MKSLILSPHFKIQDNGLAHYSDHFYQGLKESGEECQVICHTDYQGDEVFASFSSWNIKTFLILLRKLLKESGSWDKIIIQFVPHMYAKRGGLVPSLGLFAFLLRILTDKKIHLMYHELHYPFEYKVKSLVMWACHHFMFLMCLWSSHKAFFSTHTFLRKGQKYSFHDQCFWLPVGSNIGRVSAPKRQVFTLTTFGGLHPSKRFDTLLEIAKELPFELEFHIIGLKESDVKDAPSWCVFYGFLEDQKVGEILSSGHLQLSFFTDGLSSRRGSVLAALNQGSFVVSTLGDGTDELFKRYPGVKLFDKEDFKREVIAFLEDQKGRLMNIEGLDERLRAYDGVFSWPQIMRSYHELSS